MRESTYNKIKSVIEELRQSGTKPTYEIVAKTANTSKRNVSTYFKTNQSGTVNEVGIESGTDFQSGTVINVDNLINDVNQSGTVETGTIPNGTVENGTVDEVIIEDNSSSGTVKTGTAESVPDFQSGTVNDDEICVDMYTTPEERADAIMAYLNDSNKKIVTKDILEMNEIVDVLFSDF